MLLNLQEPFRDIKLDYFTLLMSSFGLLKFAYSLKIEDLLNSAFKGRC